MNDNKMISVVMSTWKGKDILSITLPFLYEVLETFFNVKTCLTVDEEEDLQLIRKVLISIKKKAELIDLKEVSEILNKNPDMARINSDIMQKGIER